MNVHLEVFEIRNRRRQLLAPSLRESEKPATAVLEWAQEQAQLAGASFAVNFRGRYVGHELYRVLLAGREFSIIAR